MVVTKAPSVHRATEHICKLYQRFYTQTIYPKVIRNLYAIPPSLFVPSVPPWHCVYLRPLRDSVCPLYKPFNLSSIFRKNLLLPYYHVLNTCYYVFYYPITMSWIPCYHVSYYPVPCLLLLCLMSSITLLPCLLLPCLHQGMQNHKKSWQVNYPKEPYSSKQLTCQLVYLCTPSTLKDSSTKKESPS